MTLAASIRGITLVGPDSGPEGFSASAFPPQWRQVATTTNKFLMRLPVVDELIGD
jgi:hypothetical protein